MAVEAALGYAMCAEHLARCPCRRLRSGKRPGRQRLFHHLRMRTQTIQLATIPGVGGWLAAIALSGAICGAAERMPPEQARNLKNPVRYSAEMVREGRKTYLRLCQYCHGADGRAQANPDFEAPSLRDPRQWRYGDSDGEVFVSIRDGAGHEMPPFGKQLGADDIWLLVHYVRSIGPKEFRPDSAEQE